VVSYYSGGKRIRSRFNSFPEARDKANAVKTALLNDDSTALQITGEDSLIYARAKNIVSHLRIALDQMAKEYADARKTLGAVSLPEAVHFYERFGKTVKEIKSIPAIVDELNANLLADGKSEYHRRDMKRRLEAFALAFPKPIMEVTTKEISDWLRALKFKDNQGHEMELAPKTRNHYRNAVAQLFNHAKDHGYLPKGMPTEAEAVKTVEVTPPVNQIFKVEEIQQLLKNAPAHILVAMAIKAFCGIRTEEMVNLQWEHIHWNNQYIILPASVTKTKQRRLIPLSPNLVAWITPHKKETGRICDHWQDAQTLTQAFDRYGKKQGVNVGANKFRNSYISYRVAVTHDVAKVALESGNSPRIIQREYLELATEEDGKRWFSVMPQPPKPKAKAAKQKRK
jgi:integrase